MKHPLVWNARAETASVMTLKKTQAALEIKAGLRMTAQDRRQQIIDVALKLFSEKGFRGTTTKEIALAAGINEAIIFRHFATKSDLYAAIIDQKASSSYIQAVHNAFKEAEKTGDDQKLFQSVAYNLLEFHEKDDTAMRMLLYSALERHELAESIFRNHISKTHGQLADYVKMRINEGVFRRVDPIIAVRGFMGMVISHVLHKKFFQYEGNENLKITNRRLAGSLTDIFLASMTNRNYQPHQARRSRGANKNN
ncbi:MAG: TetR/AcrR family transcriptional regulator [Acidobacteria bacterium]|nr:TetR/AcrR family transcriptional regulator [Acidobacteriota bacterium]